MKNINKKLALIISMIMLLSCFVFDTVAIAVTSKQHYVSISTNKTKGLKQGEMITVELRIDSTTNLALFAYNLNYDPNIFEVDTTKVSRVEKCIDRIWLNNIKDSNLDWTYYLGNPTYRVSVPGTITFTWAG